MMFTPPLSVAGFPRGLGRGHPPCGAILPASESLMPKGLLDQLNEREVPGLVAYTLARGDKADARFRGP